jgi:hypothetical protein
MVLLFSTLLYSEFSGDSPVKHSYFLLKGVLKNRRKPTGFFLNTMAVHGKAGKKCYD